MKKSSNQIIDIGDKVTISNPSYPHFSYRGVITRYEPTSCIEEEEEYLYDILFEDGSELHGIAEENILLLKKYKKVCIGDRVRVLNQHHPKFGKEIIVKKITTFSYSPSFPPDELIVLEDMDDELMAGGAYDPKYLCFDEVEILPSKITFHDDEV